MVVADTTKALAAARSAKEHVDFIFIFLLLSIAE